VQLVSVAAVEQTVASNGHWVTWRGHSVGAGGQIVTLAGDGQTVS
jgi:hypothetical protein